MCSPRQHETRRSDKMKVVLDTSVWLAGMFAADNDARRVVRLVVKGDIQCVMNAYGLLELARASRRVAASHQTRWREVERRVWSLVNNAQVTFEFDRPLEDQIVRDARKSPEYRLIGHSLGLETKDVPFVVLAFDHQALLITLDQRSLLARREEVHTAVSVEILSPTELPAKLVQE